MTSVIQPLDAGIINTVKARYKKNLVVEILREAWDEVSERTIRHCWGHTKIFEASKNARLIKDDEEKEFDKIVLELKGLLHESGMNNSISTSDVAELILVDSHEPIEEEQSPADLVQLALGPNPDEIEEEQDEDETTEEKDLPISSDDAMKSFEVVSKFVSQQENENEMEQEELWSILRRLKQSISSKISSKKKQVKITNYFFQLMCVCVKFNFGKLSFVNSLALSNKSKSL